MLFFSVEGRRRSKKLKVSKLLTSDHQLLTGFAFAAITPNVDLKLPKSNVYGTSPCWRIAGTLLT